MFISFLVQIDVNSVFHIDTDVNCQSCNAHTFKMQYQHVLSRHSHRRHFEVESRKRKKKH